LVKRWNLADGPPVFLISLRAGGAGLNLTGADHVIHLDPWWNPAVEDQATDRAHRIGQTRPVMAYRFVAKDTVEEKVIALQDKKRALFDMTVEQGRFPVEQLTRQDIEDFFESDLPIKADPLGEQVTQPETDADADVPELSRILLEQDEPVTTELVESLTGWKAPRASEWLQSQVKAGALESVDGIEGTQYVWTQ
jgi:hypothetical protein